MYESASDIEALDKIKKVKKRQLDYIRDVNSVKMGAKRLKTDSLSLLEKKGLPVDSYKKYGEKAKCAFSVKGTALAVKPTEDYNSLLSVDKSEIKNYVFTKADIKYKREEKWTQLKSLLKICWNLTDKSEGREYCCFTQHSAELLELRYGIKVSITTLRRLVDTLEKVGFLVPNTYMDKSGEIKKNYRFDSLHPCTCYSTSYLVNMKAIENTLGDEIEIEKKQEEENRQMYYFVKSYKKPVETFEKYANNSDIKSSKLFSGLYDIKSHSLKTVDGQKETVDVTSRKNFKYAYQAAVRFIREKYSYKKPEEIARTPEWQKIVELSRETEDSEEESINGMEYNLLKTVFDWNTHGAASLVLDKMLLEYNLGLPYSTQKEFTLKATNKGISTRAYSEYCTTSKKDGSRKQFFNDNNITFNQDVTAMVPNLSHYLESDEEFKTTDIYNKMRKEIEKQTGIKVSRDEIKTLFLRAKFTSSLKGFLSNMTRNYAEEVAKDDDNDAFPFVVPFRTKKSKMMTMNKQWPDSKDGKEKIAFWTSVYDVVKSTCGTDSSSLIFFWESLLELIVSLRCKRNGNMCYNIYDEFLSEKEFDLKSELMFASNIVREAYKGNVKPLKEFINGTAA